MMGGAPPLLSGMRMLVTSPVVWVTGEGPNATSSAVKANAGVSALAPAA